jgi:predicted outer membrane protein
MRTLSKTLLITIAGASTWLLCGFQGQAPKPGSPVVQERAIPADRAVDSTVREGADVEDGILAFWLVVDNKNEITIARLAEQRAQDPEVKQFAARMVADHDKLVQALQPFAGDAGVRGTGTTLGRNSTDRDATARDAAGRDANGRDTGTREASSRDPHSPTSTGSNSAAGFGHAELIQELGDQCLNSVRTELEQKQGAEFDRCFMGMAIGCHMKANDMLTVFQRHASPEFKNVLVEGQRTVKMHLADAKTLAKKLEGRSVQVATPNHATK